MKTLGRIGLAAAFIITIAPRSGAGPGAGAGDAIDIALAELYGLEDLTLGTLGLSAATTSCNNGNVDVPWFQPMNENHPFIGLAMFRVKDGILEMLGQNWVKHAVLALNDNQCDLGCSGGSGGTYLSVGCSDTYTADDNGATYFLGPRSEVNPYTGEWEACGSFFDGEPVDCERDYFGEPGFSRKHRLTVAASDLVDDAQYQYEAVYIVAGDENTDNNIGWRECDEDLNTIGSGLAPVPGAVIDTWGDQHDTEFVAPDDGRVVLATKVIDLGAGMWHYEYALYNRDCDRGIHAVSIPIGAANVVNIGFRDINQMSADDWISTIDGNAVIWSTDDYATDPDAPRLLFQTMFNFRFDADSPPQVSVATASLFKPGINSVVLLDTQGPGPPTFVDGGEGEGPILALVGSNPFRGQVRLAMNMKQAGPSRLAVVDVSGRAVREIVSGVSPRGTTELLWDGRNEDGAHVSSGVYFFRLETEVGTSTLKGILVRK